MNTARSVKQFGVAAFVQVVQCWLYLRHRGFSRPAFSRRPASPTRPTSARARHRLGCSSLRNCVKRLNRSGVLPSISTLPPPPSHVGCHQSLLTVEAAQFHSYSARRAGSNLSPCLGAVAVMTSEAPQCTSSARRGIFDCCGSPKVGLLSFLHHHSIFSIRLRLPFLQCRSLLGHRTTVTHSRYPGDSFHFCSAAAFLVTVPQSLILGILVISSIRSLQHTSVTATCIFSRKPLIKPTNQPTCPS